MIGGHMDALNIEQVRRLYELSADYPRNHLMIRLAFEHGMRASEVCSLKTADFDMTTDIIYLTLQRKKGSKETVQPLMPETAILLREWVGHDGYLFPTGIAGRHGDNRRGHITRQSFFLFFQAYCVQAGIPEHLSHPHCLKHALGTAVIDEIGIQSTRQYLGHVSMRSTAEYTHASDASASKAVHAVLTSVGLSAVAA
jgi:type 1 fimbriae regulatory protein FimB